MNNRNIVVTVRLSDIHEIDQPDPICLPADELATWRHFEALLQSMYRDPPPAIRVCYLDDESDWIEVSSDSELREAIRIAQTTDEILQLQVKRRDELKDVYIESTLSTTPAPVHVESEGPHVTPLQTTYFNDSGRQEQRLVYPQPPSSNILPSPTWRCVYPLVYPHPNQSSGDGATATVENCTKNNENVLLLEANGRTACIQNRPDLSTEEKIKRLKARLSNHKEGEDEKLKGLNTCLSFREMFHQASGYSSEDKIQFMKKIVTGEQSNDKPKNEGSEDTRANISQGEHNKNKHELLIEPLAATDASTTQVPVKPPSPTSLAVQDPFEVVCHDQPSRDLEEIQLNLQAGNILEPEKPRDSSPPKESDRVVMVDEVPIVSANRSVVNTRPSSSVQAAPIPLLYTLQMMNGAQSGANAVAIEIPEGDHHGAAQKEEDATASGGTACTSASAETGEVIGTGSCQDGAAVGDKVKDRTVNRQSSCSGDYVTAQHAGGVAGTKKSKRSKDASPLKAAAKDAEKNKKESSSKEAKKVEKKHAKAACCHHKATKEKGSSGDVKIEADVESGEKIVKKKKSKHTGLLHTTDFVKMMTKMHSELHSGIVKDVKEQTGKLLKKTLLRSTSFESAVSLTLDPDQIFEDVVHKGIYCDSCNFTISGIRYKCGNCADFDFCEKCEASNNGHDPSHVFLKLCRPAPMAGKVGVENIPLLRDIVYKENEDSTDEHTRATKIECLEDVPILSISEVTTPGEKHSPPSTPSESHKKADINNWVWDSTFDTDKHLYSLDGECTGTGGCTQTTAALSPESMGNSHQRLSDSEMKRLYALLSIEAEAAKRANNNNGEEHGNDLIVEIPKLTSVPELAESVHSISTLPSTNAAVVDLDVDHSPLMPSTRTKVEETSSMGVIGKVETSVDKDVLDVGDEPKVETDKDEDSYSQASSAELVDVDEEEEEDEGEAFEELDVDGEDDGNNNGEENEEEHQRKVTMPDHHFDSDTSDDFCVLDPPSRSDMAEEEQEPANVFKVGEAIERKLLHHTTDVPSMEIVDHVRAEGEAVSLASNTNSIADQIQDQNCVTEDIPVVEEIKAVNVAKEESTVIVVEDQKLEIENTVDGDHKEGAEASGGNVEVNEENQENVVREAFQIDTVDDDDIFLKMTAEEKYHFQEMIRHLRERAQDLENELKNRKEAEAEMKVEKEMEKKYQMILEEKQKEAVRENEKLEQFQKKKEQEEKLKRQQRLMEKEKERKLRQKKSKELKAGSGGGSACGEGAKRKSRMSSLGTKPTLMQMALNGKEGRVTKKTEKQESGLTPTSSSSLSGQGKVAPSVQVDNVIYVQSGKKDVDCQTNGRGVGGTQASQMIQHVASGVSKAAEAAFHTAKDVFYSLQAKQVEKKTYEGVVYTKTTPINSKASPTDADTTTTTTTTAVTSTTQEPTLAGQEEQKTTWTPPTLIWTPPADTFVPPKSEWTPPASDWKPPNVQWIPPKSEWAGPKSEWTGPKSEWTPPKGYYQPPGLEPEPEVTSTSTATETQNQQSDDGKHDKSKKVEKSTRHEETSNTTNLSSSSSSSVSSVPLPPLPPIQITDPILRREVQGMQLLIEMGFANREQNRKLLQEFDGDVEKVVQSLLQEEREEHWSWQRH